MKCPKCGYDQHHNTKQCKCGYEFEAWKLGYYTEKKGRHSRESKNMVGVFAGLLLVVNTIMSLVVIDESGSNTSIVAGLADGARGLFVMDPAAWGRLSSIPILAILVVGLSSIFPKTRKSGIRNKILLGVMLVMFVGSCANIMRIAVADVKNSEKLIEGGLYATQGEGGEYTVLKILKVEDHIVHVRVYSNTFSEIPDSIDESRLYMAGMDRKPQEELGIGHLPLSETTFSNWACKFVQESSVSEEELEGYRIWAEDGGGSF